MKLNKAGIDLIKNFESLRLQAYPDPGTGGKPYTVGYGATGKDIGPTTVWNLAKAEDDLANRLAALSKKLVDLIEADLNDNQFSAIVSLVYNIGIGNFSKSSMLKLLNSGSIDLASEQFTVWGKAAGKEMPGLLRRRQAEKSLFLST